MKFLVATRLRIWCWSACLAAGCQLSRAVLLDGSGTAGAPSTSTSGAGGKGGGESSSAGSGATTAGVGECPAAAMLPETTRPGYAEAPDPGVETLLRSMTSAQRIKQMYGIADPGRRDWDVLWDIQRCDDVDLEDGKRVRGFKLRDAGRGVNLVPGQIDRQGLGNDFATAFPAPSVRAASWDLELEMRVGEAIGDETMVSRNNLLLAPCMNILRHPYWGRTQDTYGEDSYHLGRMASAFTAGVQQHVVACAKHFAANNIERNRVTANAEMDEQTLREIYSRHFGMVIRDGGVGCVMAAYNSVNGIKATQHQHLMRDILKAPVTSNGFGFRGFVISGFWAMPGYQTAPDPPTAKLNAAEALAAGLDVEVPWAQNFSQLTTLVDEGTISQSAIDDSARRVLEQKFRFDTVYADSPWGRGTPRTRLEGDSITDNEQHLDLAEEAEIKSAVLLNNGIGVAPVLPIGQVTSIAVVGLDVPVTVTSLTEPPKTGTRLKFAVDVNLGDRGSGRINANPADSIGPYAGIQAAAVRHGITRVTTGTSWDTAEEADFVVVVVGLTAGDEGEEFSLESLGDRTSLSIGAEQEQLVDQVLALGKPTAIVIESGSIVNLPWLSHQNRRQATIWAGYGGMRVGAALGKLLLGEANFSGKLAMAWPKQADLPAFTAGTSTTKMDYFFGYRYYDEVARQGRAVDLQFPFGWGKSYTKFDYARLSSPCGSTKQDNVVTYVAEVTNSGSVDGEEVVMLFVAGPPKPLDMTGHRPVKELRSFAKVGIAAGKTAQVSLPLDVQDLRHWEGERDGSWVIDEGQYKILVGPNANELKLEATLMVHD